jgi:hypothetical protein
VKNIIVYYYQEKRMDHYRVVLDLRVGDGNPADWILRAVASYILVEDGETVEIVMARLVEEKSLTNIFRLV